MVMQIFANFKIFRAGTRLLKFSKSGLCSVK